MILSILSLKDEKMWLRARSNHGLTDSDKGNVKQMLSF